MPILTHFFLLMAESGVQSMAFSLEGAREQHIPAAPNYIVVDVHSASWTYTYANGYVVTLRGPLTAVLALQYPTASGAPQQQQQQPQPGQQPTLQQGWQLKIENMTFDARQVVKLLNVGAIQGRRGESAVARRVESAGSPRPVSRSGTGTSVGMRALGSSSNESTPGRDEDSEKGAGEFVSMVNVEDAYIPVEPVNSYGIPQVGMRCLEVRRRSPLSAFFSLTRCTLFQDRG